MKKLEDLKAVALAATRITFISEDFNDTLLVDTPTQHTAYHMYKKPRDYIATFSPELVIALLDEVMAGRTLIANLPLGSTHKLRKGVSVLTPISCQTDTEKRPEFEGFDKARERTDAILRSEL